MKIQLSICTLLIATQAGLAQTNNVQLSLSSGIAHSSSKGKDNLIGNGQHLQADVYFPLLNKSSNFSLGITLTGNYARNKNIHPNNNDVSSKYNLYSTALSVDSKSGSAYSNSFSGLAGIQAQFGFGRFHLSPSLNAGYLNFQQEGFTQTGSVSINGEQHQKDLVKKEQQQFNGLIIKPQLRAGYSFTESIAAFAGAAFVAGPEMKHTTAVLLPEGGFKENNTYEMSQLAKGTYTTTENTSRYQLMEFNIGLTFSLGKSRRTKRPSGAASASYAAGRAIPTSTEKSISSKGVKRSEANELARPGSPIGGIVVKGGKNPGGNMLNLISDENGQVIFEAQESGDYLFQLSAPEQPAGKSISEKGVKRSDASAMAKPGNPIGGIIVKGGKNPGGNAFNIISNANGEVLLPQLEPGSYQLILHSPSTNSNDPKARKKKKKETYEPTPRPGLKDVIKTNV
ncbi:autotransporter outer membrane beta-barrel domain-containing protein [Pseudoflavitalea sp. G-6-1-2]|uniref:autotransporter outer membrane beta-barrel domain-containing protein n=1 Tax=Pseudoflavitalea sp. G-6-1-2 TaxID=2728841 RepID=UPI00146C9554|nr:autotransporter outer membrane beta-barrel domain-containing protein [Pseudoflavitalea sp. G-6-1-2]NML19524.1 autotransporter outer membrane beta-barrel domain-containing protein [Pseudoflavitalea sp. G-6-1-2]